MPDIDPSGHSVIMVKGEFSGEEGVCLGRAPGEKDLWTVSPKSCNRIVNLRFDEDFGVLLKPSQKPGKN